MRRSSSTRRKAFKQLSAAVSASSKDSGSLPEFASLFGLHAQRIHGYIKVLAPLNPAAHRAHKRERLLDSRSFISRVVKATIPNCLIDYKLYVGLCLASPLLVLCNTIFSDEIIRIGVVREDQHLYLKVFRQKGLDCSVRCLHACPITIIVHHNFTRKSAD